MKLWFWIGVVFFVLGTILLETSQNDNGILTGIVFFILGLVLMFSNIGVYRGNLPKPRNK